MRLYKPGQGYWTRMLTFIGSGVLVVAGVIWLVDKLDVLRTAETNWVRILQVGLAVVIIGAYAVAIYRFAGSWPKSVDFMIATEGEMKKVNWPTRKEVIGSTWVVICCVALLVGVLLLADLAFQGLFRLIDVIQ